MRVLLCALLLIGLSGCEDPAKRVKSDPEKPRPAQNAPERGHIDTH